MKRSKALICFPQQEEEPEQAPEPLFPLPPHPFAAQEIIVKNARGEVLKHYDARKWADYGWKFEG